MRIYPLVAIPIILSLSLLIYTRAKVTDYSDYAPVILIEQYNQGLPVDLPWSQPAWRGETITTEKGIWNVYSIDDHHFEYKTVMWFSEDSSMKLGDRTENGPTLQLIQGRFVIKGPAILTVRDVKIPVTGVSAVTFYPWLEKLEVVEITNNNKTYTVDTLHNSTTPSLEKFNPQASSAALFYTWALGSAIQEVK